jgi:hypothetical protein
VIDASRRILRLVWWPLFPAFLLVVLGFTRDRGCLDRYHLLPGIDTQPALAWSVAAIYVLGHAWLIAMYLCLVVQTGELLPGRRSTMAALGANRWQAVAMLGVFVVEYLPSALWQTVARASGVCGQ